MTDLAALYRAAANARDWMNAFRDKTAECEYLGQPVPQYYGELVEGFTAELNRINDEIAAWEPEEGISTLLPVRVSIAARHHRALMGGDPMEISNDPALMAYHLQYLQQVLEKVEHLVDAVAAEQAAS